MHNRVVTITEAKNIDEGVAFVRDSVDTTLSTQKGFRGITLSADRTGGVFGVLTLWETEADRDASEGTSAKLRQQGLEVIGGKVTVEAFEEAVVEIKRPPVAGLSLSVTRVSMDPAKVDGNLTFFKSDVVPRIVASDGFCALRHMINRQSGKGLVGIVWANKAAMAAGAEDAETRRAEATARGVNFDDLSFREILFVDLR
jgi:heme-degrading monooxygenase HmoA